MDEAKYEEFKEVINELIKNFDDVKKENEFLKSRLAAFSRMNFEDEVRKIKEIFENWDIKHES